MSTVGLEYRMKAFCYDIGVDESLLFLLVGGILALGVFVALAASRAGVPALVAFLIFGMIFGKDGIGDMGFYDVELARIVCTIGLVVILFEGGLSTSWRRLREAFVPAVMLSTVGVVATAFLTGVGAHFLFGLPLLESFLLGAVVSSTDAAAVFATLRFTRIRRRLARILEAESGGNDPMAIALTIGFIEWIQEPAYNAFNLAVLVSKELIIGLAVGLILGRAAMYIFSHLPHSVGAFAPVASVAMAFLSFGIAETIGGSGFLAVYIVGLAIGSTPSRYRSPLTLFHEGTAFVAQVAMFVILGLFAVPSELVTVALPGLALVLFLVFVVRPFAVWLSMPVGLLKGKEQLLIGWAGLRGAVPIVLGMYVLSSGIPHSELIFNAVFFVVIASVLLQGSTLEWVARRLGVMDKVSENPGDEISHDTLEKIYFQVAPQHAIAGVKVHEIGLPPQAHVVEIKRRSEKLRFDGNTIIRARDRLCVEAPYAIHPEIDDVFTRWRRRV